MRVVFIPGNGGGSTREGWFPYVEDKLKKLGVGVVVAEFPDPQLARASFWLPFLEKELKVDKETVLIGYSSGAQAAMRYAEDHQIYGSVLVAPCHTDLGITEEKLSGYYDTPWKWNDIRENQNFIIQFSSTDDPFIPIEEARYVHEKLGTIYHEFADQQHFGYPLPKLEFPEIVDVLKEKLIEK